LTHVGLKALEILPNIVTDTLTMTGKCHRESCIKCKLVWKPFSPTTGRATEPLPLVHSDICGPVETAIRGGQYLLLFIDDDTRHPDECIRKYKSDAVEKFNEWKALIEKELGTQVKPFRTDGGSEYTVK
jgi:hypothetical protein